MVKLDLTNEEINITLDSLSELLQEIINGDTSGFGAIQKYIHTTANKIMDSDCSEANKEYAEEIMYNYEESFPKRVI